VGPFYTQQSLHFKCTECGKCCTGGEDHYIALNQNDAERIREHLGVGKPWFKRHYIAHLTHNMFTLRLVNGQCVMLDKKGKCRIYPLRPTQCRTYPWWPEILKNKSSWKNEARHCEGINTGDAVSTLEIEKNLTLQKDADTYKE